jgi:hypothetical protein
MCEGASSSMTLSDSAIEPVTGVTETRNDEAVFVEFFIKRTQDDGHIATLSGFLQSGKTLWCPEETYCRDIDSSLVEHKVDGLQE